MLNAYKVDLMTVDGWRDFTHVEAVDATDAANLARIELDAPESSALVRREVYGEWDCNHFTLAGHTPHDGGR